MPPPSVSNTPAAGLLDSDGRYWNERLFLMPDDVIGTGEMSNELIPMIDSGLHVIYVLWHKRPDVVQKGWGGPQLAGQDGELTWFGHRTSDGLGEASRISFGVIRGKPGKAVTRVPYFLSVTNAETKPQLVLTEDTDKASLWSLTAEKTWSHEGTPDDGPDSKHAVGYIKLESIPDMQLWLSLSPEPILQTRRDGLRGENKETIESRLLTISSKKEYRFQYVRDWTGGK